MLSPVLRIRNAAIDKTWNYCEISDFRRYYFITDMRWVGACWEISCVVDALASWKTQLGAHSMYVLRRDSTTDFDPMITDTLYPATNDYTTQETVLTGSWAVNISSGTFVVGIISGNNSSAVGAISYYAMTSTEFGQLKAALLSDNNLVTMGIAEYDEGTGEYAPLITDMSLELLKTMYNPYQYIASCMWFPIGIGSFVHGPYENALKIGWWEYSVGNYPMYAQTISINNAEYMYIPAHPQAATRGDYLNYSPYTSGVVYGRFGTVALDLSKTKAGWLLNFSYYIDAITGQCRVEIDTWDDSAQSPSVVTLSNRNFMMGVPIQLAQVGVDYLGQAVSAIDTVGSTIQNAMSLNVGGAISSAAHGIYNTIQASMPIVETSGANGSFLTPYKLTRVAFHFYEIVDEDIGHKGRPLCASRQLNTLSGYILCADGETDIPCTEEERRMIAGYLTSGFFWE